MIPCRFPCGASQIGIHNDFNVKCHNNSYTFDMNGLTFKGQNDEDKSKYRITLMHKETGELKHHLSQWVSFKPVLQKLKVKDSGNITGVSKTQLLKEFGTVKDQRMLKEAERHKINPQAQLAVRDAQIATTRSELSDARKGKNSDLSYMDADISFNIDGVNVSEILRTKKILQLSYIAPNEVLDSLNDDALALLSKKAEELNELVINKTLHPSVLYVLKFNASKDIRRIQLCILLNHMITFYMLPIKTVRSKYPIEGCPNIVLKFLVQSYTLIVSSNSNNAGIQVPKDEKDKLMKMILALYCYLTEYSFSINLLQVDLKASTERIKKQLQVFNVKVTKSVKGADNGLIDFVAATKAPFVIDE